MKEVSIYILPIISWGFCGWKKNYFLGTPKRFNYSTVSACTTVTGMNDTDEFKHSCVAMDVCGVKVEERANIFRIISAILHLNFILNNKKIL